MVIALWILLGFQLGSTLAFLLCFYVDNKDKGYTILQRLAFIPLFLIWEIFIIWVFIKDEPSIEIKEIE
jgi:hypothetical protein